MSRFDRFALVAVTAAAALVRLPGIASRGRFDGDQSGDMLALLAFTRDGTWPLLGAKVSVGELHQGAIYYYLLAPAAWISDNDPVVVTAWIALIGIAAVALAWWFGRLIGGSLAGALAGMLLAISPAAIEGSTFIWNPNLIPPFAILALGSAWKAHSMALTTSGRQRATWWAVAIGSAGMVIQLHLIGVIFFAAIAVLAVLELRRDRAVLAGILGGGLIVLVLFLPLIAYELQSGFQETQRVLDYVRGGVGGGGGEGGSRAGPISALAFTLLRVVGWPLVGLVTDVPATAAVLLAVVLGLTAIGIVRARGNSRTALWWLVGMLGWGTLGLAFAAPSLQTVVPGLPNDHYHAFLDPIVILLIAVPIAGLFESAVAAWRANPARARAVAPLALGVGVVAMALVMLSRKPPHVDPNGGWPAMQAAGERVAAAVGNGTVSVWSVPTFKLPDAIGFPITYAGKPVRHSGWTPVSHLVVVCDRLFEPTMEQPCGGPAEDALVVPDESALSLLERFDASPRTVVSIYWTPNP